MRRRDNHDGQGRCGTAEQLDESRERRQGAVRQLGCDEMDGERCGETGSRTGRASLLPVFLFPMDCCFTLNTGTPTGEC